MNEPRTRRRIPAPDSVGRALRRAFGILIGLLVAAGVAGIAAVVVVTVSAEAIVQDIEPLRQHNDQLLRAMLDAETGERGFVLTGDDAFLEPYLSARQDFTNALFSASALSRDPELVQLLERQETIAAEWFAGFGPTIIALRRTDPEAAIALAESGRGRVIVNRFRGANAETEQVLDARFAAAERALSAASLGTCLLVAGYLLVGVGVGRRVVRRVMGEITAPMERLVATLGRLRTGNESERAAVEGPREVREVGAALNLLAASNEALRALERDRIARERALRELVARLHESLDSSIILDRVVGELGRALAVDRAVFWRLDGDGTPAVAAAWLAAANVAPVGPPRWTRRDLAARGGVIVMDDVTQAGPESQDARHAREAGVTAFMAIMVGKPDRSHGVLGVQMIDDAREWTAGDVAALTAVGEVLERALLNAQLYAIQEQVVERLRDLDTQKSTFVSTVSHELRTPLASITGYLELLTDGDAGDLTSDQQQVVAVVERNARRLRDLIEDLLTLSRIESGRVDASRRPLDAAELVGGLVAELHPRFAEAGIQLRTEISPAAGEVLGDEAQLERVVLNLLTNAQKFTPRGGSVTVSLRRDDGELEFVVADTGVGIPSAELDKVFTRFYRASTATHGAIPGTGLGLAITKSILGEHGGRIEVSSEEGEGATFRVRLPAVGAAQLV